MSSVWWQGRSEHQPQTPFLLRHAALPEAEVGAEVAGMGGGGREAPALSPPSSLQSIQRKGMGLEVHEVGECHQAPNAHPRRAHSRPRCVPPYSPHSIAGVCKHRSPHVQAHALCAHPCTCSECAYACLLGDTWGGAGAGGGSPGHGCPRRVRGRDKDGGGGRDGEES